MLSTSLLKFHFIILGVTLSVCQVHQRQNDFVKRDDARLDGGVFITKTAVGSALRCSAICSRHTECASFNFAKKTGVCELNRETGQTDPDKLKEDPHFKYYEFMNQPPEITTEEPTTEQPTTEGQTTEEPTTEEPTTEEPTTEEPTTEEATTEAPTTEEPTTEQPTTEQPTTEQPTTEQPTTEEPTTDEPTTEQPTTEQPTTEEPTSDEPTTAEPTTEQPTTELPTTEQPTTEEPTTEKPTTEEPTTEEPTTEKPTTEEPTTEEPTTELGQTTPGGCGLGLESGAISDKRITSSGAKDGHVPYGARLNANTFWEAMNDLGCWIEVDLDDGTVVTGVITQGDGIEMWVTKYTVAFQQTLSFSTALEYVLAADGLRGFYGNTDATTAVTNMFHQSIVATLVRITPAGWSGNVRMRLELLGC